MSEHIRCRCCGITFRDRGPYDAWDGLLRPFCGTCAAEGCDGKPASCWRGKL